MRRPLLYAACAALLVVAPGCSRQPSREQVRAWGAQIQRLEAEQDSLRARATELVEKDARMRSIPRGSVVVSVPTVFLRSVITRVFDDVADKVTLVLTGLKAHVAKKVKKVVPIGEFVLDVDIHSVRGKLRPGQPS